jgi:hypothetical protein
MTKIPLFSDRASFNKVSKSLKDAPSENEGI